MADPFSVEPPQWLTNIVGRPVDMTSVGTAVGNFARQKLRGPTIEQKYSLLQRSRMQKELQMMDTRLANETADQAVQMRLNQEKSQARLEVADFLTRHSGEDAVLDAPITARTPEGVAAIYQIKENAAKFKLNKQKQVQDVELTRGLGKILSSSPNVAISAKAAALQSSLRQDGWTSENILEYGNISAEHNALVNVSKSGEVLAKSVLLPDGKGTVTIVRHENGKDFKIVPDADEEKAREIRKATDKKISGIETDLRHLDTKLADAEADYAGELAVAKKRSTGTTLDLDKFKGKLDSLKKQRQKKQDELDALGTELEKSDSSNQELNLALEAIKAGVSRESVARKYKERTGQDLPE